jgi:hypothetical protein
MRNVTTLTDGMIRTGAGSMTLIILRLKKLKKGVPSRSSGRVRNAGRDG